MAEKLRSISRNLPFISALKAGLVFFLALRFLGDRSLEWGALYVVLSAVFYSRPIFNISGTLPLFLAVLFLPFFARPESFLFQLLLALVLAVSYAVILGVKNLTLTHRAWWIYCVSYAASYVFFLSFFSALSSLPFVVFWVLGVLFLYCVFRTVVPCRPIALIATVFAGEILWITSWLPVGYLSQANFMLLIVLFISDVAHEGVLTLRNRVLFPVLSLVIAASSYWQL